MIFVVIFLILSCCVTITGVSLIGYVKIFNFINLVSTREERIKFKLI